MKNKSKASSIVEYIIPLAVVGVVVGIGLYTLITSGFFNSLFSSGNINVDPSTHKGVLNKNKQPDQMAIDKKSTELSQKKAGSLGGTADKPVIQCFAGNCTIDYGEFILTGVPEQMDEFIESSATSGGTDKLVALIEQIAKQLEEKGDTAGSLEVKKFATMGHNLATIEKSYETIMNGCGDLFSTCARRNYDISIDKPVGFDERFYQFESFNFNNATNELSIGMIMANYDKYKTSQSTAAVFVGQYKSLMDSNLNSSTKGVLSELYWHIGKLAETMNASLDSIPDSTSNKEAKNYYDPITGIYMSNNTDIPKDLGDIYKGYIPSTFTHFDSALICATGQNYDSGKKCH